MAKKIKNNGKEYKVVALDFLKGAKYAFLIDSKQSIFVSQAVSSLIESDPELMGKKLKVLRMPLKTFVNDPEVPVEQRMQDKFESLEVWIENLRKSGIQVFYDKSVKSEKKDK